MKNVINAFRNSKGANFIGLDYTNKQNETSRYNVLCGVDYGNLIEKKIKAIESLESKDLNDIAKMNDSFTVDIVSDAAVKLLDALKKNKIKETQSNQSKGQSESYASLGGEKSGVRMHLESKKIYAYGFQINKTVIKAGEPKKHVNSSTLTLAKRAVEKHLGFPIFVNFEIEKEETVLRLNKEEFKI